MVLEINKFGTEILVNGSDEGAQVNSAITSYSNGGFVIIWLNDARQPTEADEILIRIFDENGNPTTNELLIASAPLESNGPRGPRYSTFQNIDITTLENGNNVVVWTQDGRDIFFQLLDDAGQLIGTPIQNSAFRNSPEIAIDSMDDGGFVVTWLEDNVGIVFERYDATGVSQGAPTTVQSNDQTDVFSPSIKTLSDGSFIVSWTARISVIDGVADDENFMQLFDSTGQAVGQNIQISSSDPGLQQGGEIAELSNGTLAIVWYDHGLVTAPEAHIHGQLFTLTGERIGESFQVDKTVGQQNDPNIVPVQNGGFLVTWLDGYSNGGDVIGQLFSADGEKIGRDFVVSNATESTQQLIDASLLSNGDLVITWTDSISDGQDTEPPSIRAQIFRINDNISQPEIIISNFVIPENSLTGTLIGTLSAVGPVSTGSLTFTLLSDADGRILLVNGNELVVADSTLFDFEQLPSLGANVQVDDGNGVMFSQDIALRLIDVISETISAGNDDDTIVAGDGNNNIDAGEGDNSVITGTGNDVINSGSGNDEIQTGDGDNIVNAGDGNNIVTAGNGNDDITTGTGDDIVTSGDGNDMIISGDGDDVVSSGMGDDTIIGGSGAGDDIYDGGSGFDTVKFSSAIASITVDLRAMDRDQQPTLSGSTIGSLLTNGGRDANLAVGFSEGVDIGTDALIDIEHVIAGNGDDIIYGNIAANHIDGGDGDDQFVVSGIPSDYEFIKNVDGSVTISDLRSNAPEGTDEITAVEFIKFSNGQIISISELVNLPPTVEGPLEKSVNEDGNILSIDLLEGALDPNPGETESLFVENVNGLEAGMSLVGNSIILDPTNLSFQSLAEGEEQAFTITYQIVDINGASFSQSASIKVFGVNDPAEITGDSAGQVVEDQILAASGHLSILDIEVGENKFVAGLFTGLYGSIEITELGRWTYTLNNAMNEIQNLSNQETIVEKIDIFSIDSTAQEITISISGAKEGKGHASNQIIDGTFESDTVKSKFGDDVINTFSGDDYIITNGGRDLVYAGSGNDFVNSGVGKDVIYGGDGNDNLNGKNGKDVIRGGLGQDEIYGGNGQDQLFGDDGEDLIFGGQGKDKIFGNDGQDVLLGEKGNDLLNGGDGDDLIIGGKGRDQLVGGQGIDTFVFDKDSKRDTIQDFENNIDKIGLDGLVFEDLLIKEKSGSTLISYQGSQLLISDVKVDQIEANDFIII